MRWISASALGRLRAARIMRPMSRPVRRSFVGHADAVLVERLARRPRSPRGPSRGARGRSSAGRARGTGRPRPGWRPARSPRSAPSRSSAARRRSRSTSCCSSNTNFLSRDCMRSEPFASRSCLLHARSSAGSSRSGRLEGAARAPSGVSCAVEQLLHVAVGVAPARSGSRSSRRAPRRACPCASKTMSTEYASRSRPADQRAQVVRELLGQHRHDLVGDVDAGARAPAPRRRAPCPAARSARRRRCARRPRRARRRARLIEIASSKSLRVLAVDREDRLSRRSSAPGEVRRSRIARQAAHLARTSSGRRAHAERGQELHLLGVARAVAARPVLHRPEAAGRRATRARAEPARQLAPTPLALAALVAALDAHRARPRRLRRGRLRRRGLSAGRGSS